MSAFLQHVQAGQLLHYSAIFRILSILLFSAHCQVLLVGKVYYLLLFLEQVPGKRL